MDQKLWPLYLTLHVVLLHLQSALYTLYVTRVLTVDFLKLVSSNGTVHCNYIFAFNFVQRMKAIKARVQQNNIEVCVCARCACGVRVCGVCVWCVCAVWCVPACVCVCVVVCVRVVCVLLFQCGLCFG